MGGRGAFIDITKKNFTFVQGGQKYQDVGRIGDIRVLKYLGEDPIAAPVFSHSANRTYLVLQGDYAKYLVIYGKDHTQSYCIDFGHKHRKTVPHVHYNLDHSGGYPLTAEQDRLVDLVKKHYKTDWSNYRKEE